MSKSPGHGCFGQDMVDDNLQWPRLEELECADENDQCQGEDKCPKVRAQVGTSRASHRQNVLTALLPMAFAPARNRACALEIPGHGKARVRDGIFGVKSRPHESNPGPKPPRRSAASTGILQPSSTRHKGKDK